MKRPVHFGTDQPRCNGTGTMRRAVLTNKPAEVTCKRCLKGLAAQQLCREALAQMGVVLS